MNDDGRRPLEDWLQSAWGPHAGCPPPESFLPSALRTLDAEEVRRLEAHLRECLACAAERDLATAFEQPVEGAETDLRHVLRELKRGAAVGRRWTAGLVLAAAALLVLAALALPWERWREAPPVPAAPSGDLPVRGAVIRTVGPRGELPSAPDHLAWQPTPGATTFELTLKRPDGTILWRGRADGPEAVLPPEIRGAIENFVVYSWEVHAIDDNGRTVARSRWVHFQVTP
jgi:hypothetical protein